MSGRPSLFMNPYLCDPTKLVVLSKYFNFFIFNRRTIVFVKLANHPLLYMGKGESFLYNFFDFSNNQKKAERIKTEEKEKEERNFAR